jgi:hypothetical protein
MSAADDALKKGEKIGKSAASPKVVWIKTIPDALATTPTAEFPLAKVTSSSVLKGISLIPSASVPAVPGDASLIVRKRGPNPGTLASVSWATSGANTAAWGTALIAVIGVLEEGDIITLEITKSGGGVILPTFLLALELEIT